MAFLHPGYFPINACSVEGTPPDDQSLEYPFEMSLKDYMALFWQIDSFSASGNDEYYFASTGVGVVTDVGTYNSSTSGYLYGLGMPSLVCETSVRTFLFSAEVVYNYDPQIYPGTPESFTATQEGRARLRMLEPTYTNNDNYYPRIILDIRGWYGAYGSIGSTAFSERRNGIFTLEINNNSYITGIGLGDNPEFKADLTISPASTRPTS
jgi:hypothetical protein